LALGITILLVYMSFKFINVQLSWSFLWYSLWFGGIVMSALMTELFQNTDTWIYNSLYEIEKKNITDEMKFKIIKEQLQIAVNRYDTVFFAINGKDVNSVLKRIIGGSITVKELILISLYALYDLVLKGGYLSLIDPYDISVVFIVLVLLRVMDANSGFANLVVEMYNKAFNEKYTSTTLTTLTGYIRQLCLLFHIDYNEPEKLL